MDANFQEVLLFRSILGYIAAAAKRTDQFEIDELFMPRNKIINTFVISIYFSIYYHPLTKLIPTGNIYSIIYITDVLLLL